MDGESSAVDGGTRPVRSDASRQQILACTDLEQLKVWLRKAATAESVQELFGHAPASKSAARKTGKQGRSTKAPKSRSKQ